MLESLGRFLFRVRSFTPVPLLLIMLYYTDPTRWSVTMGFVLLAAGELVRLWAVGYAGSSTRTRSMGAARDLVTTGPYAYVRNPLYLGNGMLSTGICVFSGVYWLIPILLVGFLIQYVPIVRSEEAYLSRSVPQTYQHYLVHINRWVPSRKRYMRASDHDFSWVRALHSERRTLLAIVLVSALLVARTLLKNA